MGAVVDTGSSGGRGSASQDVDLNIAPIIDAFVVLIAFLLASASFLSIGMLDAGVAAAGATPKANSKPPAVSVSVILNSGQKMQVKVTGKQTSTFQVPSKDGEWNHEQMTGHLSSLKSKWKDLSAVTLEADNSVEYKNVIKAMEVIRKTIPVVLLGGF